MNIPTKLTAKLEEFLAVKRETKDSGWANVERCDISDLYDILEQIIAAKFEADCDDDLPIDTMLIDRNKYESIDHMPVPHRYLAIGIKDEMAAKNYREEVMDACIHNMKSAMDRVDTEVKVRETERLRTEKENATFQKEDEIQCLTTVYGELTRSLIYTVGVHSRWQEGVEYVRIKRTDSNKCFTSWPVSMFKKKMKEL